MTKKKLTDAGDKKPPTISNKGLITSEWMVWNNSAEKRDKKTAWEFLHLALDTVKNDETIFSLAGLSVELDTYDDVFEYLIGKHPWFSFLKYKINKIIESRVHKWAITGKIKETTSIFTLKNNHWWKDKIETENTNTNNTTINEIKVTIDEK